GGRIWVESDVGAGSRFHFVAEFGVEPGAVPTPRPPDVDVLTGVPVLVVDDNATNRRILEEMLARWRMKPRSVKGARAALEALRAAAGSGDPFRLVLSDALMPDVDGFALGREIRKDGRFSAVALIMLSSSVLADARSRAEAAGFA